MPLKHRHRLTGSPLLCMPLAAALLLAGCSKRTDTVANVTNSHAPDAVVETIEDPDALREGNGGEGAPLTTDAWVGRWTGPEGLFLDIQPSPDGQPGHYAIINKDTLDRQANYRGVGEGALIRLERDGKELTIRPGNGRDTGFKHLADKTDCLIVIPNQEGYCR